MVGCICQYRYVIGVVGVGSCFCGVPSAPFFRQLEAILSDFVNRCWVHYMDANKTAAEEARRQLHKNAACNLKQVLAATPHKTPTVRSPASYHENDSS